MAVLSNKFKFLFLIIYLFSSCININKINYSDDIYPIITKNCVPCHYKNGPAPFKLTTFSDVNKRSKMINYVIQSNYMPPWPPDHNYSNFVGEKYLSHKEKKMIENWVYNGKEIGDTSKISFISQKNITENTLGNPDVILRFNKKQLIEGNNKDKFLIGKLSFELEKDTNIKLIEFVPDSNYLAHHVNAHLILYDKFKSNHKEKYDLINSEFFSDSSAFEMLNIPYEDGTYPMLISSVCNYLPGVEPVLYPAGIGGYSISKQTSLLIKDIHYGPSPINVYDNSYFKIYFTDKKPKRKLRELVIGTNGDAPVVPPLVIPPNEQREFNISYKLNKDISLLTINPHMHLLGKKFLSFAVSPDNDTIPLIKIDNWDFRWQYFYTFKKIKYLPKNSKIFVNALFDNTDKNPDNPNSPPQFVSAKNGSMKTTDEMLQLVLIFVEYENGDENIKLSNEKK